MLLSFFLFDKRFLSMSSLYLQYQNLPASVLTYFYYFQFRIASFFHVTDVRLGCPLAM